MARLPPVQIQPALAGALEGTADVRAMVRFRSKALRFGQLPVSNSRGNPRQACFAEEVQGLLPQSTVPGRSLQVVALMANLGVATLMGSPQLFKQLLARSDVIAGAALSLSD